MTIENSDGRPRLEFWFEFASTYSYITAMRIEAAAADAGVAVVWRPFLLGPIFGAQGWTSSPFNLYPVKGAYMWRDVGRLAEAQGLVFQQPDPFPQNSLHAARIATAALAHPEGPAFCKAVYHAEFAEGRNIAEPSVLADCLTRAGLPSSLGEAATDPAVKDALKGAVSEAQDLGIFGAPSFISKGELFWGDDRLEMALAHAKANH